MIVYVYDQVNKLSVDTFRISPKIFIVYIKVIRIYDNGRYGLDFIFNDNINN